MSDQTQSLKYGDFEIDFHSVPESSILALVRRGLTHYMSNEVSSKVSYAENKAKESGEGFGDVEKEVLRGDLTKAAWQALLDGTIGSGRGSSGPRGSALETLIRRKAKEEVSALLRNQLKLTLPKKAETPIVFPNGDQFTIGQLIDRRLAHVEHGPRIRKEAEKEVAKLDKLSKVGVVDGGFDMDAIGL